MSSQKNTIKLLKQKIIKGGLINISYHFLPMTGSIKRLTDIGLIYLNGLRENNLLHIETNKRPHLQDALNGCCGYEGIWRQF